MFGRHRPLSSPFYPAARLRPHDPPMTPPSVRRGDGEWPAPPPERPRTDPPPPSRFADERRYRAVEERPSSKPTAPSQGTPPAPPSAPRAVAAPIAPDADDRAAVRRALADLEAAERRVEANAKRVYDETRAKLVTEVLPVLDDLDRTIRASEKSADRALLTGVRMVRTELEGILVRFGLEPIAAKDVAFDPAIHEAIMGRADGGSCPRGTRHRRGDAWLSLRRESAPRREGDGRRRRRSERACRRRRGGSVEIERRVDDDHALATVET